MCFTTNLIKAYLSLFRFKVRDLSRHVILGSQQFKPQDFANQINVNMDTCWGIIRCIINLVMAQKDGKYLIVKDPI